MYYTDNAAMVRVDRFKENGKWYDTQAVDMSTYYHTPMIHQALRDAINNQPFASSKYVDSWLSQGGFFVCLEPFHMNAHPIVLKGN